MCHLASAETRDTMQCNYSHLNIIYLEGQSHNTALQRHVLGMLSVGVLTCAGLRLV